MIAPVNQGVAPVRSPIIQAPAGSASSVVPFTRVPAAASPLSAPIAAPPAPSSVVPFVRPTAPINPTPVASPVNPVVAPVSAPPIAKTPILPYIPVTPIPQGFLPPGAYYPDRPFGIGPTPTLPYVPRPANVPSWAWPYPEPPMPNEMPSEAMEPGPEITPGVPPPYTGGQSPGVFYNIRATSRQADNGCNETGGPIETNGVRGPISFRSNHNTAVSQPQGGLCPGFGYNEYYLVTQDGEALFTGSGRGVRVTGISVTRADGQPDTGGDPPGGTEPVRAPNPARRPSENPRPLPPYEPTPQPQPEQKPDLPWPQSPLPIPTRPLEPINPTAPAEVPGFTPQPPIVPSSPTQPTRTPTNPPTFEPGAPANPPQAPITVPVVSPIRRGSPRPAVTPTTTPKSPFLPAINPDPGTKVIPGRVNVPAGGIQPVITPSGPQIGTSPTDNPNIETTKPPVVNAPTIPGGCCPDLWGQKNWEELQRVKRSIGTDNMPVSVPDQIAKKNPVQIPVGSLAELHLWQVQQLDGVAGQWPIEIGIDTPGGNVGLAIPNMAEAIAEQMGLLIGQQVTNSQILNTASRTLAQSGSATQQAHLAHLTAKANADFLGYESRANSVDMPLAYTPGKNPFDGLLNESTAKIQGFQNTDGTDIKAIFAELLQAAAIIRAVYWRKLDTKGDLKKQLRENVRGQGDFLDKAAAGDGNDSDWEAYLKQVAEGFRGQTGDTNPYNRPPTEGPQIKDCSPKKDDKK